MATAPQPAPENDGAVDAAGIGTVDVGELKQKLKVVKRALRDLQTQYAAVVKQNEELEKKNRELAGENAQMRMRQVSLSSKQQQLVVDDSEIHILKEQIAQTVQEPSKLLSAETSFGAPPEEGSTDVKQLQEEIKKLKYTLTLINQDRALLYDEIERLRAAAAAAEANAKPAPELEEPEEPSAQSGVSEVTEEVFENQRFVPFLGWKKPSLPLDRANYSDAKGHAKTPLDRYPLPEGWRWASDWKVDVQREVDNEGWEYSNIWGLAGWSKARAVLSSCRRRRWIRVRKFVPK